MIQGHPAHFHPHSVVRVPGDKESSNLAWIALTLHFVPGVRRDDGVGAGMAMRQYVRAGFIRAGRVKYQKHLVSSLLGIWHLWVIGIYLRLRLENSCGCALRIVAAAP